MRSTKEGKKVKHSSYESAFTGLEAAIVLIAFVVVAAVFSYVVLGAGFFTTQKAQETVHTSVSQSSSSLEIVGNVYGIASGTTNLDYVNFTVALTAGGTAMDMDQMVVSYSDSSGKKIESMAEDTALTCANTIAGTKTKWCIAERLNNQGNANSILDSNEQFIIAVGMPTSTTPNTQFTVNMQPAVGAVTSIKRTVPGALQSIQILY
jgi:flagellin FlaB